MDYSDYGRRWRPLFAVLAGTFLWACNDLPLEKQTPAINPQFAVNGNERPAIHPNSQRYRAQTTAHATGRSGSAVITARALLDMNGNTDLELTTGALDQPGAPGNISKVQLKFFHPASTTEHETALNYNGLSGGGTWSHSSAGHVRNQAVQAQANVRGIDPKRTDVVTVTESIKLRPDIAVMQVNAPSSVVVGTNVTVMGSVAELNGDVGATSNCVFYVNGQEEDRTDGVWVADGDQVTCAFLHQFNAVGTYTITVAAESVVPGDWDTGNNTNSVQITVTDPVLHGNAYASDYQQSNWYRNYGSNNSSYWWGYYYQNWDYYDDNQYRDQYIYFYGTTAAQWAKPFAVNALVKTNGYTFDGRSANNVGSPGSDCAVLWTTGFNVESCTYPWGSYVYAYRWAGDAWYYSYDYYSEYYCDYYYGCSSYQSGPYYSSGYNNWGTWYANLGNDVTWEVEVATSGTGTYTGNATIPLSTWYDYSYGQPFSCSSSYYYYSCYGYNSSERYRSGSTNF